jgi:hypothetical protein
MSIQLLEKFIPNTAPIFLRKWIADYAIHFKITRERVSKLGDYQKLPNGSHRISINGNMSSDLFFFVLTHEIAHLIAREQYGNKIMAHGKEWKHTYRIMLLESISVYPEDLRPIILKFSKSPKAGFFSDINIAKYFYKEKLNSEESFLNELEIGQKFIFRNDSYLMIGKGKKNYLCKNLTSGREYIFRPLVSVTKI